MKINNKTMLWLLAYLHCSVADTFIKNNVAVQIKSNINTYRQVMCLKYSTTTYACMTLHCRWLFCLQHRNVKSRGCSVVYTQDKWGEKRPHCACRYICHCAHLIWNQIFDMYAFIRQHGFNKKGLLVILHCCTKQINPYYKISYYQTDIKVHKKTFVHNLLRIIHHPEVTSSFSDEPGWINYMAMSWGFQITAMSLLWLTALWFQYLFLSRIVVREPTIE